MKNNFSRGGIITALRLVVVVMLGALAFQNCAGKANSQQSGDESVVDTTDSVIVDTVVVADSAESDAATPIEPVAKEKPAPSMEPEPKPEKQPETSQDLKWARVQGPVKTISEKITYISEGEKSYSNNKIRFSAKGKYIPSNPKLERITRNKKGQIELVDETDYTEYGTNKTEYSYTYDKNGFVISEYEDYAPGEENFGVCVGLSHSYTLNENGWIVKDEYGGYLECSIHGTDTYTYSNFDKCGNWQKCVKKCKNVVCAYESTSTCTITRKITYWK